MNDIIKKIAAEQLKAEVPEFNVGDTVKFRNILAIDLTTAFGAGNEPTKEQMDAILSQFPNSYFNGTVSAH